MEAVVAELRTHYGDGEVAFRRSGTSTLVRVNGVGLPRRKGKTIDVLIDLQDGFRQSGSRPPVYVALGTTQPNGRPGRNVNPAQVHGEPWLSFSWSFEWRPGDLAWLLVEGAVRRFSVNED